MSWVTDIILIFNHFEDCVEHDDGRDTHPLVDQINDWLSARDKGTLACLDCHAGGRHPMTANVYGGAFNGFDVEGFLAMLRSLPWREPQHVQVLTQDEGEYELSLFELTG